MVMMSCDGYLESDNSFQWEVNAVDREVTPSRISHNGSTKIVLNMLDLGGLGSGCVE